MKITEKIERECCKQRDLLPLRAPFMTSKFRHTDQKDAMFCKFCGQVWVQTSYMDAAGGTSHALAKIRIDKFNVEKLS